MRLRWSDGPRRPAGKVGTALLAVVTLGAVLAAAAGIGYTAARPLLNDGSAFLGKGHSVARVNGETGETDAEVPSQLATGKERLEAVGLPGGRLAVVNKDTGRVLYLDATVLTADSEPVELPGSAGKIEVLPTASDGYLVDTAEDTVGKIATPGAPATGPLTVREGIKIAVPCGDSIWVVTDKGDILEIADGHEKRRIRLGAPPLGITVADSHPVAVTPDGTAYVLDGDQPRAVGELGISGQSVVLGAWRGAGRRILAVDRAEGRLAVLDPRTGQGFDVELGVNRLAELAAPVMLGDFAYVPDHSGPSLWKIDLRRGEVAGRPLEVPGQPGVFDLQVTSGRVWANSQYDRSTLMVNADGDERYADKGASPELTDSEGQSGLPERPERKSRTEPDPDRKPQVADVAPQRPVATAAPTTTPKTVTVPDFERGTPHQEACTTITQLGLRCQPVSVPEEDPGLEVGDVLGTRPEAGRQVAEGSRVVVRHLGPLQVPPVTGLSHEQACRQLADLKLKCVREPAAGPALAPDQLGMVSVQDPPTGTEVAKGSPVTVTYPDTIALPNLVDQPFDAACTRLKEQYRMRCVATQEGAPPAGKQPGQVHAQVPPADEVVAVRTVVTLRYFRGQSTPASVVGTAIQAACATIQAEGLQCVPVEGDCAGGTGRPVGEVYNQNPPGGTPVAVGSQVTLTHYSEKCTLGNYNGQPWEAACNEINAKGFTCNPVAALNPTPNVAFGQNPPAGPAGLGTSVTIHYAPWAPAQTAVGTGYPLNTPIPGGRTLYHHTCNAGGGKCRGLDNNQYFSLLPPGSPTVDPDFQVTPVATLMTCGTAPGQRRVWRTWNGGSPRRYDHVASETRPAADDSEELGCVW